MAARAPASLPGGWLPRLSELMTDGVPYLDAVAQIQAEEAATQTAAQPRPRPRKPSMPDPARHGHPDPSLIHPGRSGKRPKKHWTVLVEEIRRNPGMTEDAKYGEKDPHTGRRPLLDIGFHNRVVRIAMQLGWLVNHSRRSRSKTGAHVTAVQGDTGAPDLMLARRGVVILAELKKQGSYPSPEQRAWCEQIPEAMWRLWRPADIDSIVADLNAPVADLTTTEGTP